MQSTTHYLLTFSSFKSEVVFLLFEQDAIGDGQKNLFSKDPISM